MGQLEQFIEFLKEYTIFFEETEKKQEEKLAALTEGDLDKIEETIVMQQALDKQMQNMEERRLKLFESLGASDRTFKEIISGAEGKDREELRALYERLDASIGNIRFLNQKCMKTAESALVKMGTIPSKDTGAGEGYRSVKRAGGSILETKV